MPNIIQHKRSSISGVVPVATGLSQGELAINIADGKFYTKNNANVVINLGVTSISGTSITPASGNFINSLQVNGTGVSISGHAHTSSNITDFNSSVSGLLPVKNIIAGSNITVSNNNGIFTISSSGNTISRGSFLLTSSSGTFNVSGGYTVGSLDVFLNGVKLFGGGDYTASNGTSFTLTETATSGSVVEYIASTTSSAGSSNSTQSYSRSWFLS
jgi:hypothetical protein